MLHTVGDLVAAALGWWLSTLRACVPSGLLRRLGAAPDRLAVRIEGGRVGIALDGAAGRREIGAVDARDEDAPHALTALVAEARAGGRAVTLELGPSVLVEAMATLPIASLANLDEVLRAEMDRLTPFAADDVFFAHEVAGTDEAMERLNVRLQVARRADVTARLDLCRVLGLAPVAVTGPTEAGGRVLDLMPPGARPGRSRFLPRLTATAAALCLIAGVAAALTAVHRRERELARSEALLAEVTRRASAMAALDGEVVRLTALATHVVAAKRERPMAIAVLDDLTRTLPDAHWLDGLTLEDSEIAFSGVSTDASAALERVARSTRFEDARFAASVRRERDTGQERFSIAAIVAGAEEAP